MIAVGIVNDAMETAGMANSVNDTDGVYFVPAFSGLQVRTIYYNESFLFRYPDMIKLFFFHARRQTFVIKLEKLFPKLIYFYLFFIYLRK